MKRTSKVAVTSFLLAAVMTSTAAPAEAHGGAGLAIGAGLLGLGIGAAIATDHPRHYYADGYGAPPPPPPAPVGYYEAPPPPAYYAPPPPPAYGYDYVQHCRVVNRWNPEWGQYQQVRRCW